LMVVFCGFRVSVAILPQRTNEGARPDGSWPTAKGGRVTRCAPLFVPLRGTNVRKLGLPFRETILDLVQSAGTVSRINRASPVVAAT
jgi:hypothetical protein